MRTENTFDVRVDYNATVEDLVKAGRYGWADEDITSAHFPSQKVGVVRLKMAVVCFDRFTESEDDLAAFEQAGFRGPALKETLAFGARHPKEQLKYAIVGLSQEAFWRDPFGLRLVPFLWGGGSGRGLGLRWFDDGWGVYFRFLVVASELGALAS